MRKNETKASLIIRINELEAENKALNITIDNLLKEIERLKEPPSIITQGLTPEEEIIDVQVRKLQEISRRRELSLEETKKFDLLIKNQKAILEGKPVEPGDEGLKDFSDAHLLRIVAGDNKKAKKKKGNK